jgi:[protein-PII] uridylyltransferase
MSTTEPANVRPEQIPGGKPLLHLRSRLPLNELPIDAAEISKQFRSFLKIEDQRLRMAHRRGAAGCHTAAARSSVLDLVVERAFQAALRTLKTTHSSMQHRGLAVVAVGGFGRGELAPYSDLDLLFLYGNHHAAEARKFVEEMLRLLWDAGLTIGHGFRGLSDCVMAARGDAHLRTALITTRLLVGDEKLYGSLHDLLEKDRRKRSEALIATIQHERDDRYAKFGAAVCLQEPNVKESAGGIRDLHTALWYAYARYGCRTLAELYAHEIVSEAEVKSVPRAANFLWRIRYAAHLSTRRKTERIDLDLQTTLAREFGYKRSAYLLGSEKLMREYYQHAQTLHLFSEKMLTRVLESAPRTLRFWGRRLPAAPAETLSIVDGRVDLETGAEAFGHNPSLFFDVFALAQAANVPLSLKLKEAMRQNLGSIDRGFRTSPHATRSFLKLLGRRGRGGFVLRLMHEVGFLGRFVPEFGRISQLIQHDHYHHYTIDEHTLKAVEALDELHLSQDKQRAHLRTIFDEIHDPAQLYLSVLLHDIGKGRGRGHIPRGVKIAETICERLALSEDAAVKIVLLVKHHVAMSQLAQRRDLNEPHVVADFASQIGTLDALNLLLLLTYGDLNAVAPGVWSEWKSTLLWDLYRRTRVLLTGSEAPPNDAEMTARFREQVANCLAGLLPLSEIERHIALLPDRYVRITRPDAAATHLQLIEELNADTFARRWTSHGRTTTELTICTRDRHSLCADIAGSLAAQGIEILSAELNTREDGIALDVFILREASTHHAIDMTRYPVIERALRKAIAGDSDIGALVERWRTKNAPRKRKASLATASPNLPQVVCDNEASESLTLVEVRANDEAGLVYKIASGLASLGLDIVCAKIATEKSDALDVFYVTDDQGMKLSESMMQSTKISLTEFLSNGGAPVASEKNSQEKIR